MKTRSTFGWADLLFGIASILLGIYILFNPVSAIRTIVFIIGGVALIGGVSNTFFGFRVQQNHRLGRTVSITASVLNIFIALLILFNVGAGAYLLSIFLPVWFIAHCVSRLANLDAFRIYGRKSLYWSALILNVLGIALATLLLLNPSVLILSIEFLTGSYLVLMGISSIIAVYSGFRTKTKE